MGINANIEVKRKMAAYIIENNVSSTEVAKHFNTSRSGVMQHINYLKDIDYELYKKAITVLKTVGKEKQNKGSQKTKDEIKLEVANYIIKNKCTYVEASRHFGKCDSLARKYVASLEKEYPEIYKTAKEVAKEASKIALREASKKGTEKLSKIYKETGFSTNPEKQNEVANWIIDNNATIKQTAERFNVLEKTISKTLRELEKRDNKLYLKVSEISRKAAAEAKKAINRYTLIQDEKDDVVEQKINDANKMLKKIAWFKNNLKHEDVIKCKVIIEVEVERRDKTITTIEKEVVKKCVVKDVYPNYLILEKYGICYYDKCISKLIKKAS